MRFIEAREGGQAGRLTQAEAARLLDVRAQLQALLGAIRGIGLGGLLDKRLVQSSHRRASAHEVMKLVALYQRIEG